MEPILKYYSESGFIVKTKNHLDEEISLKELVDQYFGNVEDYFQVEPQNDIPREEEENEEKEEEYDKNIELNTSSTNLNHTTTTTTTHNNQGEKNNFDREGPTEEYFQKTQNLEISQQKSEEDVTITTNLENISKKLFDKDNTNKIIDSNSDRVRGTEQEDNSVSQAPQVLQLHDTSLISCHYCNFTSKTENEVIRHSVISHPGKPARPDPSLLESIKNRQEKDEEEVRSKE
jgi:hypothetical protein